MVWVMNMEPAELTKALMEIQKDVSFIKTDTGWIKKEIKIMCAEQKETEAKVDEIESWKSKVTGALIVLSFIISVFGYYVIAGGI
jgi:ribosomal protein L10